MMTIARYRKDPDARLDYVVDWVDWLGALSDTLVSAQAFPVSGVSVVQDTWDGTKHTVWLEGGEVGKSYEVTSRIWTTAGRIDDRTIEITVEEK